MIKTFSISFFLLSFFIVNSFSQVVSDTVISPVSNFFDSTVVDPYDTTNSVNFNEVSDYDNKVDSANVSGSLVDTLNKEYGGFQLESDKTLARNSIDTSATIYGWTLDKGLVDPEKYEIDTSLVGFQNHNIVLQKFILPSNLSNTGSAYMPIIFSERDYSEDIIFMKAYKELFSTFDNTVFYNTKKPFSHLYYFNGADKSNKEEFIELLHTQNINPRFNFGFDLKVLSDKGLYKYLMVKNRSFKAFSSYSGRKYNMHSSFNYNRYIVEENGGIIDTLFEINETQYTKLYDVNFSGEETSPYEADVSNKVRYIDGLISQKFKLFTLGKVDTIKKSGNIAEPSLSHIFTYRRTSKMYEEASGSEQSIPIYNYSYANPVENYDSVAHLRVTNCIRLDFKTKLKNKVTAGFYGAIGHEYHKHTYYSLMDSSLIDTSSSAPDIDTAVDGSYLYYTNGGNDYKYDIFIDRNGDTLYDINKNISLSNLYVAGGFYGRFWTYFQSKFSARLYFAGYRAGDLRFDGDLLSRATIFSKPFIFSINGAFENIKPSYQLNNYYSNKYIWEDNNFNFINRVSLSSKIASPSKKFELSANYVLLRNHIYFTNFGPEAYNNALSVMSFSLARDITFWKIHFYNRIVYQASENKSIIEVPAILLYNSTYFDKTWKFKLTGGKLRTMLGFDVRYCTQYSGYSYNPALALFYQENNGEIGNYPFIDVWFNLRLKRTRFFAKFEHYNSTLWNRKDYYYAVSYPAKESTFKFGISWTFYD
jgi:hypothetical protein